MKVLKVFGLIFCIAALVCIPISLFPDVSGYRLIGVIGYASSLVGCALNLIISILRKRNEKTIKPEDKDKVK